jgi:hypothetical protein
VKMGIVSLCLVILASISIAADRCVLFEDFTNSGCGPCWSVETQVNAFVNANLSSGNLCVIRTHVNWPAANDPIYLANPTEQTVRKAQYGVSSVPYFKIDGILNAGAGNFQTLFDQRVSVPAVIAIDVARIGDEASGTLSFRIIAEEDPGWTVPMMLWPILVEDNIPGVGYWAGSVFEQAFRDNLLGPYGEEITFDGTFPDTVYADANYAVDPSWDANELYLATFVQCAYQYSEHEVENCNWAKFLDIQTGIGEAEWNRTDAPFLSASPNPSNGEFSIAAVLPENSTGTVQVFNLAGRMVYSGSATEPSTVSVTESGVYLMRLTTSQGASVTGSIVVIR